MGFGSASLLGVGRNDSTASIGFLSVLLAIVSAASYCVYQIYFHPLSKFPGPRLNAITRLPVSIKELNGDFRYFRNLHNEYGRIVRVAPNELTFVGSEAWKDIQGSSVILRDQKHLDMEKPPGLPYSLNTTPDREHHRRLRAAIRPAFSGKSLSQMEPLILDYSKLLVRQLRDRADRGERRQDLAKWYNLATFDIMHFMCFSQELGGLQKGEDPEWLMLMVKQLKSYWLNIVGRKQPSLKPLVRRMIKTDGVDEAMGQNFMNSVKMVDQEFSRLDEGGGTVGNLWAAIKKADNEGVSFPFESGFAATVPRVYLHMFLDHHTG